MCFRKKIPTQIKIEKTLVDIINEELTEKEKPIVFNFNESRDKFYFCGKPYNSYDYSYSYKLFNFACAVEQINRAIDLLKTSLIRIKNKFIENNIKIKIVVDKINSLLDIEKLFQSKMKEEEIKHQQKQNDNMLFSSIEMFQELSREYLQFVIKTKSELIDYTKKNLKNYDIINSVSANIHEQSNILPLELHDFKNNLNGYTIVYNLENFIRVLILIVLKRVPTKQMMDEETYKYLNEQKKKEKSNKWCDERYGGDLFYLTFAQLVEIIKYNDSRFKEVEIDIKKINTEIDKICIIRHKIAHNNLLTNDDIDTLKVYSKNIYKYFNDFTEEVKNYKFNKKTP